MSRIRKTSETRPLTGHVVNAYSESEINAYSTDYINNNFQTQRTLLYENTSGSNSNITLSESAANFTYIDIFYRNQDNYHGFVRVYSPNGKAALLPGISSYGAETYFSNKNVRIQGTSINNVYHSGFYIQNNAVGGSSNSNDIYITRVEGWK